MARVLQSDGGSGLEVRQELNAAILAVAQMCAGAAAPAVTYAYMWWIDTANSLVKQRTAANDAWVTKGAVLANGTIMWGLEADALAALISPTANTHMIANAGGTAWESAAPYKIGSFTRDLSAAAGTQEVTGVGFKPSTVLFLSGISSAMFAIGIDNGTIHCCCGSEGGTPIFINTASVLLTNATGVDGQYASISAMDIDGFTLDWTKIGVPASVQTVYYLALR